MRNTILGCLLAVCLGCGASEGQVATGVEGGITVALCILNTAAADDQAGMSPVAITSDVVSKCATDALTVANVLDAQKKVQRADESRVK